MTIQAYFIRFQEVIDQYAAAGFVVESDVKYETRPGGQGYLTGTLLFIDSSSCISASILIRPEAVPTG